MSKKRKILCVDLKEWQWEHMRRKVKEYGFGSMSELVRATLAVVLWHEYDCEHEREQQDEIKDMFDQFANHQRQPDGTVPVRHPSRKLK